MIQIVSLVALISAIFNPLITEAWSSSPCEEPSAKVLATIVAPKSTKLVACGIGVEGGRVGALSIIRVGKDDPEILFQSDDAFKTYQIDADQSAIKIREGFTESGTFRPILELITLCKASKCEVKEHQCLWKKAPLDDKEFEKREAQLRQGKGEDLDVAVGIAFKAALSGSKRALKLFREKLSTGGNAAAGELYETLRADIKRLKTVKCL